MTPLSLARLFCESFAQSGVRQITLFADEDWATMPEPERGGDLVEVPAAYTSQTCSACGVVDSESRQSQSAFVCTACGHTENADVNAAKNILARGLLFTAAPKKPAQKLRQLRRKPKAAKETVKPTVSACGGYPDVVGSDEPGTGSREAPHRDTGETLCAG
jgi:hypothetical protein